jgi:(p)ppGpp synthase/HD superfamily hydrolase
MSLRVGEALAFFAVAHSRQLDKGDNAYFWHPLRVARAIRDAGYGENHQIAGLGHDAVEDTEATLAQIQELFGDTVTDAIDALTRRGHYEMTPEKVWVWDETYKEYIIRCCKNPIGRVVKLYDVYDNADPRRYCKGVPISRYVWALEYLNSLNQET